MFPSEPIYAMPEKDCKAIIDEKSHDRPVEKSALESFKQEQGARIARSERETKARVEARDTLEGIDSGFVTWAMAVEQQPGFLKITSLKSLRRLVLIWKMNKEHRDKLYSSIDSSEKLNGDNATTELKIKAFLERLDKIFLDWDKYKVEGATKDEKPPKPKYCHVLLTFGPDGPGHELFDETTVSHNPCGPRCNIDSTLRVWSALPYTGKKEAHEALKNMKTLAWGSKWQVHAAWTIQDKPRQPSGIRKLLQRVVLGPDMLMVSRAANAPGVMVVFVAQEYSSSRKSKKPADPFDGLDLSDLLGLPEPAVPAAPVPAPAPQQGPGPDYPPSPCPHNPHRSYYQPEYYGHPGPYGSQPWMPNPSEHPYDAATGYYYPPQPPYEYGMPPPQPPMPYDPNTPPQYNQMTPPHGLIPYEGPYTPPPQHHQRGPYVPPGYPPQTQWNSYPQYHTECGGPGGAIPRYVSPPPVPKKKKKSGEVPVVIGGGVDMTKVETPVIREGAVGDLITLPEDQSAPSSITQVD